MPFNVFAEVKDYSFLSLFDLDVHQIELSNGTICLYHYARLWWDLFKLTDELYYSCTYVNKCYFTFTVEKLVDSFERDPVDAGTGPDHSLTRLLAHAVKYYGVSPLFKVMRFEKDKFAVSFSFSLFVSVRPYCFINSAVTSG